MRLSRSFSLSLEKFKPGHIPGGPAVTNRPSNAGGVDLTPGRGTKIQHAQLSVAKKIF